MGWRLRAATVGMAALGASCTLAASDLPARDDAAAVAQLLTDQLDFEGGTVIAGAMPAPSNADVQIVALDPTVIAQPGRRTILALGVSSRVEAEDPIVATLIRFGDTGEYISVARSNSGSEQIDNAFTADGDICATLCRREYPITMTEAFETDSGEIGQHGSRTFVLDCTNADARECAGSGVGQGTTGGPLTSGGATPRGDAIGGQGGSGAGSGFGGNTAPPLDPMFDYSLHAAAGEGWTNSHGCADGPQRNVLADEAAQKLLSVGPDNFSQSDLQPLGPDPFDGRWTTFAFPVGEEAYALDEARRFGESQAIGTCGGTSIGVAMEQQGAETIVALVLVDCIECSGVCAPVYSAYCGAAGMAGAGGGFADGFNSEGSPGAPVNLGPAENIGPYDGTVSTGSSFYRIGAPPGGWWVYLEGASDNVEMFVYTDPMFLNLSCMLPANSGMPCSLMGDGTADRFVRVDGRGTTSGASFILDVQP